MLVKSNAKVDLDFKRKETFLSSHLGRESQFRTEIMENLI